MDFKKWLYRKIRIHSEAEDVVGAILYESMGYYIL